MRTFFLDTADPQFVENARNQLRGLAGPKAFLGVTTNPKAIAGICKTQGSARRIIEGLAQRISEFRGDNDGQLFIQLPGSQSSFEDMVRFIEYTYNWGRPYVKVGYKLPHFRVKEVAQKLQPWSQLLNVTGVTNCSTFLDIAREPVAYISLLTGRMEERGVNAQQQLNLINSRVKFQSYPIPEIITGSMRTIEQLDWCWNYWTLPTIGRSLWQDLTDKSGWRLFQAAIEPPDVPVTPIPYDVTEVTERLSQEFFEEMDGCSKESADFHVWG